MIEAALPTGLSEGDRLEYLCVSAVYYRFVAHLTELKADIENIVPGGPLIPDPGQR